MKESIQTQIRRHLPEQHTTGGNPSFSTTIEDEEGQPTEVVLATERDPIFIENNLAVAIEQLGEAQRTLSHIKGAIHNPALADAIDAAARELIHTIKSLQPLTGKAWTVKAAEEAWEPGALILAARHATFTFESKAAEEIWKQELRGQISDGAWENTPNSGWPFYYHLSTAVRTKTEIVGTVPGGIETDFDFAGELLKVSTVKERMLKILRTYEPTSKLGGDLKGILDDIRYAISEAKQGPAPKGVQAGFRLLHRVSKRYRSAKKV